MSFLRDIVFALRQFRRHPWLPLAVVVSLGTAMGVSTSLFSIVNGVWFTPWRVADAGEIRIVRPDVPIEEWRALASQTRTFSGLVAHRLTAGYVGKELLYAEGVSANYFDVLRVPMTLGHPFTDAAADRYAAVLGYRLWQSAFGGDPNVVGKAVTVAPVRGAAGGAGSETFTVVGVAGEKFHGTERGFAADMWRQLAVAPGAKVAVFGRLDSGVSDDAPQEELGMIVAAVAPSLGLPAVAFNITPTDMYSQAPPGLMSRITNVWNSTLTGVFFITIIACANVTNLLLALGHSRRGEIGLRLAIGASRARVIRQLLTETLVLSLAAGAMGLGIAAWLPNALLARIVTPGSRLAELFQPAIDHRVFLWSLAVSVLACFGFGLVPALRCTEDGLHEAIKSGQANSRKALMPDLLSVQTIVSAMALSIAGIMLRSDSVRNAPSIDASPAGIAALVVAGFGGIAVVLGAIGYLSLLEYLVSQRTREIGIRRALGAQGRDIVNAVAVSAAFPVLRGLMIGGAGGAIVGAVLWKANLPEGVHPLDATIYAAVGGILLATTAIAAYGPTRRALRVEPQEALRND